MKKSRAGFWMGTAVFFTAAIYTAVLFLLKSNFDASAWVSYGATMIAFLLAGIQLIAFSGSSSGVIMDTALGVVTAIYFGLQFVFGGILCMFFADLPLTPVIVCELILLAVYLATVFVMYAAQSSNAAQDDRDKKAVLKIRLLEHDVRSMAEETANSAVKKALEDLAESIHYGDVTVLPGLADVEGRIAQNIAILQDELTDESADPLGRIEKIQRMLKERDRTAAILKRSS